MPANSILPTRTLATLQNDVLTQYDLPTRVPTTLQNDVLTQHDLPMRARTTLLVRVLTEQASSMQAPLTRPIDVRIEPARATQAHITLPIDALTDHARTTRTLTVRPTHVLAAPAPPMRIVLPAGVLAAAWPRTYPEDPGRPGFFTGIAALDHEIGGISKAALTQVCAPRGMSSGKAAILCSLLAQVTDTEEVCALIDAGNCFDPGSAATAGVDLSRLLWVRCGKKMKAGFAEKSMADPYAPIRPHTTAAPHAPIRPHMTAGSRSMTGRDAATRFRPTTNYQSTTDSRHSTTGSNRIATLNFHGADAKRMQPVEQAFKAADILIQNGGFGLIAIDLGEIEERLVRKIPLTTWFRFARVIERQPTALVVFATYPAAQSCAALTLHIKSASARWHTGAHTHAQLFSGLDCEVELGKTRGRVRKQAQSAKASFVAKPVWK